MKIIPAIDIIEGKCVRLSKGDYDTKKIYNENPVEVAKEFEDFGIQYLHLVDLDGAKAKKIINQKVIENIAKNTNLIIDFGGGIRSEEDLQKAFDSGAKKVTLGSIAVVIASIWQIPICLLLTRKTGLLFPIAANTLLGIFMPILLGNTALSWVCPYCWAAKTAELIMGIESNGTFSGVAAFSWVVLLPLVFSVILYALLTLWDAEHFSDKEGK